MKVFLQDGVNYERKSPRSSSLFWAYDSPRICSHCRVLLIIRQASHKQETWKLPQQVCLKLSESVHIVQQDLVEQHIFICLIAPPLVTYKNQNISTWVVILKDF